MFIISLVFVLLRIVAVLLGIVGVVAVLNGAKIEINMIQAVVEIGSGAAMVLFGLLGNGLMLAKKRTGYLFGWLLVFSVLVNIGTGLFGIGDLFNQFQPGSPELIAALVTAGFFILIRFGLLAAYIAALLQFKKWIDRNEA